MPLKSKKIKRFFEIDSFYTAYDHDFKSSFTFSGESHGFWEATYVYRGNLEVTCDDKVYNIVAGDLIFYPPFAFHKVNRVGKEGAKVLNISFSVIGDLPSAFNFGVFSTSDDEGTFFKSIFNSVKTFIDKREENEYVAQFSADRLSSFIIELSFNHNTENRLSSSPSAIQYQMLVSSMRENVYHNFSITEFASSNNISISYIKNLFSRYAGVAPKRFYSVLRLNEAKTLLKNGNSVSEVADKLNFSSPNYFSLYFKKSTGMTPLEYKKNLR